MSAATASSSRLRQPKGERVILTEARGKAAVARAKRYWIADVTTPGLALRVSPTGDRGYYVRGRIGKGRGAQQVDFHLGDPATLPLAEARREAMAVIAQFRQGLDPRASRATVGRVSALLDDFEAYQARRQVVKVCRDDSGRGSSSPRGVRPP